MIELGLPLRERTAFAIIYSFSQENEGCWWGSLPTMAKWLDCSKRHAIEVLKRLQFEGLITKRETFDNGVKRCIYYVTPEAVNLVHRGGETTSPGVVNSLHQGGELSSPNNKGRYISKDKKEDNIYTPNPPKFNFRKSLLEAGASADTADQWLEVRRNKRLTNTELALADTLKEIRKAGLTVDAALRECVIRSWGGFKAEWLEREQNGGSRGARPEKLSGTAYMIQQMERRQREQQGYDPNDLPDEQ